MTKLVPFLVLFTLFLAPRLHAQEPSPEVADAVARATDALEARDFEAARQELSEAIALLEGLEGEVLLQATNEVTGLTRRMGAFSEQLAVMERLAEVLERIRPADDEDLLNALQGLADTRRTTGDLEGALELEERVLEARARLLPEDHPQVLSIQQNLAVTLNQLGQLERARQLEETVHEARERLLPSDHQDLLGSKMNLGATLLALRELEGARDLFEQVHAVWSAKLPPEHPHRLMVTMNLAVVRSELGDLQGALELDEQVHAVRARVLPADHLHLMQSKLNLASTRAQLGDTEGARVLTEQVHEAWERQLPGEHPALLTAKLNLAIIRKNLGDLEGARQLEEVVLAARERTLPPDHPDLVWTWHTIAATCHRLGDYERALELCQAVFEARASSLPSEHPDLLMGMLNLAATRFKVGQVEEARALFDQVEQVWGAKLAEGHPYLVGIRQNVASGYRRVGDHAAALPLDEAVLETWSSLVPPGHYDRLGAEQNLAIARIHVGDTAGAAAMGRVLLEGIAVRTAGLQFAPPRSARSSAARLLGRLPFAFLVLDGADEGDRVDAFEALENLRAVSTRSGHVAAAARALPALRETLTTLQDVAARINDHSATARRGIETEEDYDAWSAELFVLAEERDALQARVGAALEGAQVRVEPITAEAVASGLAGGVLVTFFRYTPVVLGERGAERASEDTLRAFVVEGGGAVRQVDLGGITEVEDLVLRWRAGLGRPLGDARSPLPGLRLGARTAKESAEEVGRRLRSLVLDPCFPDGLPERLHVVLDDVLHLVPFDALPGPSGGLLGDECSVHVEVSALRLTQPRRSSPGTGTLLAVGDVDYEAAASSTPILLGSSTPPAADQGLFVPLAETGPEVSAVASAFPRDGVAEPVLLLGAEATKAAFAERVAGARFVHIATHGWFAPERFRSLGQEPPGGAIEWAEGTVSGFAAETLCGIALAGANRGVDEGGRAPGLLTAEELATLDLTGCELVVLSACETNVGRRRAGQGVQSLQSALHAAGARTAVTSLWRVDDAATRRLMTEFYDALWRRGLTPFAALRAAKGALREAGSPVRDWAGWVLTGNPD